MNIYQTARIHTTIAPKASPTPQPVSPEVELYRILRGGEVELKSDVGMDYTKLRDLLKAEEWLEADEETERVLLAVAKREKEYHLTVEHIDNFPCTDLRTIDRLWVKYSNGKFGFSVQKRIYQGYPIGGTREFNYEIWEKFEDEVGWIGKGIVEGKFASWLKSKGEITFDMRVGTKARPGLFPTWYTFGIMRGIQGIFFSRIETCGL